MTELSGWLLEGFGTGRDGMAWEPVSNLDCKFLRSCSSEYICCKRLVDMTVESDPSESEAGKYWFPVNEESSNHSLLCPDPEEIVTSAHP